MPPVKNVETENLSNNRGKRSTRQREIVLSVLRQCDHHIDAYQIYLRAREKVSRLSLSTVYRALAPNPEVLLLDEPFSNLDADLRIRIRNEVKGILACAGATVIFVTHDQQEAMFMGDRVGVMNRGKLEQLDTPEAIFHAPATPFVAQFIGTADFLDGKIEDGTVATEIGKPPVYGKFSQGSDVRAMIRPDFLDIKPAHDGVGEIVDRVFQGMHYLYRVRLPSGATVRSLQHHTKNYPAGTKVSLHVNSGHKVTCFSKSYEMTNEERLV